MARFVQCDEKKISKLQDDKGSLNTKKSTKLSHSIFNAYLKERKIPDLATAENLEQFYENSTSKYIKQERWKHTRKHRFVSSDFASIDTSSKRPWRKIQPIFPRHTHSIV